MNKQIFQIIRNTFKGRTDASLPDVLKPTDNLELVYGFDSLDKTELTIALEKEFNITISDLQTGEMETVQDVVDIVNHLTK